MLFTLFHDLICFFYLDDPVPVPPCVRPAPDLLLFGVVESLLHVKHPGCVADAAATEEPRAGSRVGAGAAG